MLRLRLGSVWGMALSLLAVSARADEPNKPDADPAVALIDQLTEVAEQDTGYSGSDSGTAFLPLGQNERGAALLSPRQGKYGTSEALRSLVKLGVKAVPALLNHLSDERPTKIVITHRGGGLGGMFIGGDKEGEKKDDKVKQQDLAEREAKYTVRVGDLCYVALGQIVNREYTAVQYIPTAMVSITNVPKSKRLREGLVKEWGRLTAKAHQDSLANDLGSDRTHTRLGASFRLAYYYPKALESLVLKQFARPAYDDSAVNDLIRNRLYPAKTAQERKELADGFVKKHGEIARDGLRWELFHDLDRQIADEEGRVHPPYGDRRPRARECLIAVFGFTDKVKTKDGPKAQPLSEWDQGALIDVLRYDRSVKIDRTVRDWLAKTDSDYMGFRCLDRLVARGYDADIAAYIKRRLPATEEQYQKSLREYEGKLGWTWLHKAVELDVPDLIEAALKDNLAVNAQGKDGRTALHLAAADGKRAAVEQVLGAKADPNVRDADGKLAVQLAAFADHPEIVRVLMAAKSEIPDVLVAATIGNSDRLAVLLKADPAGAKTRTKDGLTPLHIAAREGHSKAAEELLAAGADSSAVDVPHWDRDQEPWRKYTPLHLAAMAGEARVVKVLLDHGANANAADKYGPFTPLPAAAPLLPALLDALRNLDKSTSGLALADALAALGPVAVEPLVQGLDDPALAAQRSVLLSALERMGAAGVPMLTNRLDKARDVAVLVQALGQIGPPAAGAVPKLAALLKQAGPEMQGTLMNALSSIGPGAGPAVPELLDLLAKGSPAGASREQVLALLGRIGPPAKAAIPQLTAALRDPSPAIRVRAAEALWLVSRQSELVLPTLRALFKDAQPAVFARSADVLLLMGSAAQEAVPAVIEALADKQRRVRALGFLQVLGPAAKPAAPAVAALLQEQDAEVRTLAAWTLARIDPAHQAAVPVLIQLLLTQSGRNQLQTLEALGRLGPTARTAVPALQELWRQDLTPETRFRLMETLILIERKLEKPYLAWLRQRLHGLDRNHAVEAAGLLGQLDPGNPEVVAVLVALLQERGASPRPAAARALGKMGPAAQAAVPALESVQQDGEGMTRAFAILARWRIDGQTEAAVTALVKMLQERVESPSFVVSARTASANVLGEMEQAAQAATPALVTAWRTGTPDLRREAGAALKRVNPKAAAEAGVP